MSQSIESMKQPNEGSDSQSIESMKQPIKGSDFGKLHIEQFNALFSRKIIDNTVYNTEILNMKNFKLIFDKIEIQKPHNADASDGILIPSDCRIKNLTYGSKMFIKVKMMIGDEVILDEYKFTGTFPIMVKSSHCHLNGLNREQLVEFKEDPYECGGYFIIKGYERLIKFNIALRRNYPFFLWTKPNDNIYSGYKCLFRSVGDDEIGQRYEIKHCVDGNFHFRFHLSKRSYSIPIILLLRALKNATDKEIFEKLGETIESWFL